MLTLPGGSRVRAGSWPRRPTVRSPEFGVYLDCADPRPFGWPADWVRWCRPWLPLDRSAVDAASGPAYRFD